MPTIDPTTTIKHERVHRLEIGENAFWLILWVIAGVTLCATLAIALHFSAINDELIAKSRDPIETRCALTGNASLSQQCQVLMLAKDRH